ncbi:olfactory receptor 10G4-like [Alosa sapidissima]|uniref:olfactory receptor 10G4-like n=1 Tax=Alosa sapidissima TaxID=34773 RepID=UPI001C08BD55|nr:olfactory receptor 10G4-like [Alosa sapidissima]
MGTKNDTAVRVSEFIITGFDHLSHQKLLGSLILISYVLTLVGCGTNVSIIVADRRLHSPMYVLICNLAIVDITFSTSSCITMIAVLLAEMKSISFYSCFTGMYCYHLGDITSILTLTWMAVDRMLAISLPLRYITILTNRRCIMSIVATWIIGMLSLSQISEAAYNVPYCQPIIQYVFCDYAAMIRAGCVNPGPYFSIPSLVGWWLWLLGGHFTLIFLTYVVIVWTVLRLSDKGSKKKMFTTCISHIIVVSVYYAPKLVSVLLTRVGVTLNLTERNALLIVASTLPPLINPIIYCLTTKELRAHLINLFTKNRVEIK